MKRNKKIILSLITVFLLINVIWFLTVEAKYKPLLKGRQYNNKLEVFEKVPNRTNLLVSQDGYSYGVKKPNYLSTVGNLSVTKNISEEKSQDFHFNNNAALIVWIKLFSDYEYGVMVPYEGSIQQIYVDRNGNPTYKSVNSENDKELIDKIIDENKKEIDILFQNVRYLWYELDI